MRERTYTRRVYAEATAAWNDYGPEWAELKRIAFDRGFPFPPDGTRWDDPDADEPTQRAIIWQWLDARPREMALIASRSRSWSDVIAQAIQMRTRLQEDAALWDADDKREKEATTIEHRESVAILAGILQRIDDSR